MLLEGNKLLFMFQHVGSKAQLFVGTVKQIWKKMSVLMQFQIWCPKQSIIFFHDDPESEDLIEMTAKPE